MWLSDICPVSDAARATLHLSVDAQNPCWRNGFALGALFKK